MYSEIASNKRKTWAIMLLFVLIIAALGWLAGKIYSSPYIFYGALVGGGLYALVQYFFAAKLATAMSGAREIKKREEPRLYRTVENLTIAAGMPMPKVYIIDDSAPNAFATGRDPNHSIVVVTSGLLDLMDNTELEGVIAHELSHIRNYDIRLMMIVFGLVSAIGFIADMLLRMMWFRDDEDSGGPLFMVLGIVAAIMAPFVAMMVQMSVSRRREYLADSSAALLTRYPDGLASALEKISAHGSTLKKQNTATAHFYIANPLKGKAASLFSTHPPIKDRINKLRAIGNKL
ncbi:MAG: M48 family metallopeptidase [Candidatus Woesebacteria bacterium]|jgi:heat shock protein HtpX